MRGLLDLNLLHLLLHLKLVEVMLEPRGHQIELLALLEHRLGHPQLIVDNLGDLIVSIVFLLVLVIHKGPVVVHLIILQKGPSSLGKLSCLQL